MLTDIGSSYALQIKRIHEYKRQYMNVLSIIWRYKQLKKMTPEQRKSVVPRVCIIGGKAASAYDMAKRIIRLVNAVGEKINHDPDTKDYLRLYFLPDYNVSLAETIIPGEWLDDRGLGLFGRGSGNIATLRLGTKCLKLSVLRVVVERVELLSRMLY